QFQTIERMEKSKMLGHELGFAALDVTDHVPFYRRLRFQSENFFNGFLGVIFSQNFRARFDRGLNDLDRVSLGDDHEPHRLGRSSDFARRGGNGVQGFLIAFADGKNEIKHEVILTTIRRGCRRTTNYASAINAPKRPVLPFSARCENQSSRWQAVQMSAISICSTPDFSNWIRFAAHK